MRPSDAGLVFSHFLACFLGIGTMYTIGYWIPALLEEFQESDAQTQAITGLLQTGWALGAIPARALLKRCGFRQTYIIGALVSICVFIGVSFAPKLQVAYLMFFAGVGMQGPWIASASLIPRHLSKRDAARFTAFAVTGSGFGTMAWASMARVLLPLVGWRISFRIIALTHSVLYAVGAIFQKPPPPVLHSDVAAGGDYLSLFKNSNFNLTAVALIFSSFGYLLPFLVQGAHAARLGVSADDSATAYTLFGMFSIFGRVGAGIVAGFMNPLHVWTAGLYLITGSVAVIGLATDFKGLAVGNSLLGMSSGPMIALLVPAMRELVGANQVPEALVIVMVTQTVSALPGPVIAGWLADATGSYRPGIVSGACALFISAIMITIVTVRSWRQSKKTSSPSDVGEETKGSKPNTGEAEVDEQRAVDVDLDSAVKVVPPSDGAIAEECRETGENAV